MKKYAAGTVLFIILSVLILHEMQEYGMLYWMRQERLNDENFRRMEFDQGAVMELVHVQSGQPFSLGDAIACVMYHNQFDVTWQAVRNWPPEEILGWLRDIGYESNKSFRSVSDAYGALLSDLKYFPIPRSTDESVEWVTFEESWMDGRTYGGTRSHEGCDIMGMAYPRGYYPVVSVSDGIVEKVGWLPQGGWRVGIRSTSGVYYYYAHLYSFAGGLKAGMSVKAGTLIGYMGDSGYGETEGTVGNFPVHLHFGIYLTGDDGEEISVNPYNLLLYLEANTLLYRY